MFSNLRLYNFKNHKDASFDFDLINLIYWENGSGKTNILEAIYLLINAKTFGTSHISNLVKFWENNFMLSGNLEADISDKNIKLTFDKNLYKTNLLINSSSFSRQKFLNNLWVTALFFSPQDINIMYLGPSLRREFLDETMLLSFPNFSKVKSNYAKILKNRNKLLKDISLGKSQTSDLKFWDEAFCKISVEFYSYRLKFIDFVIEHISSISSILENKYLIEFNYETKVDLGNISGSISAYLAKNQQRDILLGHTYIGPHLDDFYFKVQTLDSTHKSEEFLSRWENKSLLLWLKFLQIEFLEKIWEKKVILLLDDVFSELDDKHISLILEKCENYQTFITAQNIPNFTLNIPNFKKIILN